MGRIDELENLLRETLDEVKELRVENQQLRAENEKLRERVTELEEQLVQSQRQGKRQAAPFRRKKRKPKSKHKKSGRKPGHDPARRQISDKIDKTVEVPLDGCCPECHGELGQRCTHEHFVTDIPPVVPVTTKFVTESGTCLGCGQRWNSSHPDLPSHATGAAGVMVGHRAVALAAQMRTELGASLRKIASFLSGALGLPITGSGVLSLLKRASGSLAETCENLVAQLQESSRVCADETGWRMACESAWAWVFTNDKTTFYRVDKSRGHGVVLSLLGRDFQGILQSDCFLAYSPLPFKKAKCLAHLLKALGDVEVLQTRGAVRFPRKAKQLFRDAIELEARRSDLTLDQYQLGCLQLEKRLDRLLAGNYTEPKNSKLANRIEKYKDEWLVFLYEDDVEPTNNLAERQIRPFVLSRKISAGNRSAWGALVQTQLMSVFSTCAQRGLNYVDTIIAALAAPERAHLQSA